MAVPVSLPGDKVYCHKPSDGVVWTLQVSVGDPVLCGRWLLCDAGLSAG